MLKDRGGKKKKGLWGSRTKDRVVTGWGGNVSREWGGVDKKKSEFGSKGGEMDKGGVTPHREGKNLPRGERGLTEGFWRHKKKRTKTRPHRRCAQKKGQGGWGWEKGGTKERTRPRRYKKKKKKAIPVLEGIRALGQGVQVIMKDNDNCGYFKPRFDFGEGVKTRDGRTKGGGLLCRKQQEEILANGPQFAFKEEEDREGGLEHIRKPFW